MAGWEIATPYLICETVSSRRTRRSNPRGIEIPATYDETYLGENGRAQG